MGNSKEEEGIPKGSLSLEYRISIAPVWHQYSIRDNFNWSHGEVYGTKKKKRSPS